MNLDSDKMIEKNDLNAWEFLLNKHELVKAKKHPKFKFTKDFYRHHGANAAFCYLKGEELVTRRVAPLMR